MSEQSHPTPSADAEAGPLFNEFPIPGYDSWRALIDKMLKGAPFEKKLVTPTYEGISLQPLYRRADIENLPHVDSLPGFAPYVRATAPLGYIGQPWQVAQELPYPTPDAFNAALRADLERGQTAVNLPLDQATRRGVDADQAETVGVGGVSISTLADLEQALAGVDLETTPIYLQASTTALPIAGLLIALLRRQGKSLAKLQAGIGMDPLGALARDGSLPRPLAGIYDSMAKLTAWAAANAPGLQTITVQGHPYSDGGASATQELAFTLATAVEYLRALQERGVAVNVAAPRVRFAFSLGSNCFMEIARLRAARLLWAKIVQAFGGDAEAQKMVIHARTALWNKTAYDPYVNMLRTTVEAFAGVIGGADSLHVAPFDEVLRAPDEFSRRIARNTHTILREESHLTRTVDPVGGSWYVEWLTDAVARQTWSLFQSVEKQGGLFQALQAGGPQGQVAEVAAQRLANLAVRKDIAVGTNMYANPKESLLDVPAVDAVTLKQQRTAQLAQQRATVDASARQAALAALTPSGEIEAIIQAAQSGATVGEIARALRANDGPGATVTPVCIQRGTQQFENLRAAADAYLARTGQRPTVFLASMGPLAQHKARSDFTRGFLEVGGFAVIENPGFATVEEAASAALASAAPVVAICSTDASYPELVPPLLQQLKVKTARPNLTVLLAGYPKEHVAAFKAAGVDDFVYVGANGYEILRTLQQKTGVIA